ncbi:MAG TPA: serine/threonine-protein kinase [Steroidobacteraceae bacterium]|jgi:serine/threonine protein kinase|nr:serine/threonine-protein kinase [Steroidobacteraceae bacterium]
MAAAHALAPALLAAQIPALSNITFVTGGGQKFVYRADHATHGPVALKVFSDFADPQRTQREIEAVKSIACAHVPTIYETGVITGGPKPYLWLVEEWLAGDTLRSRLDAGGAQSDAVIHLVARDVLFVLSEAEKRRIVHRDVKPENIFLATNNSKCWLLDFGIARHLDLTTITAAGAGLGPLSPGYAPPEQIQNYKDKLDCRADLFALGVTLYECLMGVNPYTDGTVDPGERMRRTLARDLPRPTREIDAGGQFGDLVHTMSWRRPSLRPRTAAKAYEWLRSIGP